MVSSGSGVGKKIDRACMAENTTSLNAALGQQYGLGCIWNPLQCLDLYSAYRIFTFE